MFFFANCAAMSMNVAAEEQPVRPTLLKTTRISLLHATQHCHSKLSDKQRLPQNDDGKGRTTIKERGLPQAGQKNDAKSSCPHVPSRAPHHQGKAQHRQRHFDDTNMRGESQRGCPTSTEMEQRWQETQCPEGRLQKNNGGRAVANTGRSHHQSEAQQCQRQDYHHKTTKEASKKLNDVHSFKVARNEVENASFAQRSAHRDSRIWRPELIEPAAECKQRARGRRPTFKSAYPDPQILPQCHIQSNYPL